MHQLHYIKHGKRRTPYCECGWVGPKVAEHDSAFHNTVAAQDYFVDHLRSLTEHVEDNSQEWEVPI